MTFSKEQISQAFTEVLNERVPDLSNIPDHTFSERFEKNMNRLIKKEAAHPWAVSHVVARNLIAAALVIILLFTMCMSVSAIRNKIYKFLIEHFKDHNDITFELPVKEIIDQEYTITKLPKGFALKGEGKNDDVIVKFFEDKNGNYISFEQMIPLKNGISIDNERAQYSLMTIDNYGVYISSGKDHISLLWEQDGYVFSLTIYWNDVTLEDAIGIFHSLSPIT